MRGITNTLTEVPNRFDSHHYNENDTPANLFEEAITTKESYKSVRGAFGHLSSNPVYTRDISYLFDQNI